MPFLHFTVAVEYKYGKRLSADDQVKIAREIEASLVRHADTVAVQRSFEKVDAKAKTRVLPIDKQVEMRGERGWHTHDNDSCCTCCGSNLYGAVHQDTL